MIELYVMRHGVAEEQGSAWPDDALRPLTAEGEAKTREVASGLRALEVRPDVIVTSPLVRARRTALLTAAALGLEDRVHEHERLAPGGDAEALLGELAARFPRAKSLLLVGHEPDGGRLIARLLGAAAGSFPMKKAGVGLVELDALPPRRSGTLRFLLQPAHLRAIGRDARG